MNEWVLNEAEELVIANALRYYITGGVMSAEDELLAYELIKEFSAKGAGDE